MRNLPVSESHWRTRCKFSARYPEVLRLLDGSSQDALMRLCIGSGSPGKPTRNICYMQYLREFKFKDMDSKQAYEARRNAAPWRAWYKTQRWQNVRAAQLRASPMCSMCKSRGVDRVATVAHHVVPHGGDYASFWHGELSSSCASCHDSDMQRIEGGARARPIVDSNGWPSDIR